MSFLSDQARQTLAANDLGHYTIPRKMLYPFQWNWDSCFAALGFAAYDEKRAWVELDSLFEGQWDNGMVPHILFRSEPATTYCPGPDHWHARNPAGIETSGISNPPVAAHVIRQLCENTGDTEQSRHKARTFIPKLFKWHQWWHEKRDPDMSGLVFSYHPWETGRDNSHDWSAILKHITKEGLQPYERKDTALIPANQRPDQSEYDAFMALVQQARSLDYDDMALYEQSYFKVADTTINFILSRANQDLLWLIDFIGGAAFSAERKVIEKRIALSSGALQRLWNDAEQAFQPLDFSPCTGARGRHTGGTSSAAFLSLFAGNLRPDQIDALSGLIDRWHKTVFLLPSYAPDGAGFSPEKYWMGPVWAIMNYMIYHGLRTCGRHQQAANIATDTSLLMKKGGFAEYYNPIDGAPLGGSGFSWTAAMWLHWLEPLQNSLSDNEAQRLLYKAHQHNKS